MEQHPDNGRLLYTRHPQTAPESPSAPHQSRWIYHIKIDIDRYIDPLNYNGEFFSVSQKIVLTPTYHLFKLSFAAFILKALDALNLIHHTDFVILAGLAGLAGLQPNTGYL